MILGFGTTPAEQRHLETLSSAVEDLHVVVSWDALYEPCALRVVAAADLSDRALIDRVTQLRHVDAFAPLVLLTDPHPENLVHLAGIIVDRVGWLKDNESVWAKIIASERRPSDMFDFLHRVRTSDRLSEHMRIALLRLARSEPPFRTVRQLSTSLGCSESTLRQHFSRMQTGWRLQDLIDWFLVVRLGSGSHGRIVTGPSTRSLQRMRKRLQPNEMPQSPPRIMDHDMIRVMLSPEVRVTP
jgi:AraC-like DNA-binding protein